MTSIDREKLWSRFVLRLKNHHPFFAAIALFTRCHFDDSLDIAQTKHKSIHISEKFLSALPEPQQFSYLLHQVLHLALGHPFRVEQRDITLWNMSADIVVNNIIAENTELPPAPKTAWDRRFAGQSVERVYASLYSAANQVTLQQRCQSNNSAAKLNESIEEMQRKYDCVGDFNDQSDSHGKAAKEYWRGAMVKAKQLRDSNHWGKESNTLTREVNFSTGDHLNWRDLLWKFASPAANNFKEFDQRFIHRKLYLETLESEQLKVEVVIDTSGSISDDVLSKFISELLAIHQCHPDVLMSFYYLDVKLNGPYAVPQSRNNFPAPLGLGGTDFRPYFEQLSRNSNLLEQPQAIILFTDGFGDFPSAAPTPETLWALTEDGAEDSDIPFGTLVRIH